MAPKGIAVSLMSLTPTTTTCRWQFRCKKTDEILCSDVAWFIARNTGVSRDQPDQPGWWRYHFYTILDRRLHRSLSGALRRRDGSPRAGGTACCRGESWRQRAADNGASTRWNANLFESPPNLVWTARVGIRRRTTTKQVNCRRRRTAMLTKRGGSRRCIFYRFINIKRARCLILQRAMLAPSCKINCREFCELLVVWEYGSSVSNKLLISAAVTGRAMHAVK